MILYLYENLAGLKINFDKSEILLTIEDSVKLERYADVLNYQMGFWRIKYLGALVSGGRVKVKEILSLLRKNKTKI
jgi:hypothetical protein